MFNIPTDSSNRQLQDNFNRQVVEALAELLTKITKLEEEVKKLKP